MEKHQARIRHRPTQINSSTTNTIQILRHHTNERADEKNGFFSLKIKQDPYNYGGHRPPLII
jgi:hypothetical protein